MSKYQKPAEMYDGLRLHQNENTGGCSPKVLAALAALRPDQIAFYPPYEAATRRCAAYLGVDPDRTSLVNGLDEGIMAAAIGYLRPTPDGFIPEAIIPEPAFEIFAIDTEVVGGRPVRVAPNPDFSFPLDRVLAAITPRTRVVFMTNPNNPTGVGVSIDAIKTVARQIPAGAIVFLDEAYFEFSGSTFIPDLDALPQRHRRTDVLQGVRAGRHPDRRDHRRSGRARTASARHSGLQRQHRRGRRGQRGARRSRSPAALPAAGRTVEGAPLSRVRSARRQVLEERRQFRAGVPGRSVE